MEYDVRELVHAILITKQSISNRTHHHLPTDGEVRRLDRMMDTWVRATGATGGSIKAMRRQPGHAGAPCSYCRAKRLRAKWEANAAPEAARAIDAKTNLVDAWIGSTIT